MIFHTEFKFRNKLMHSADNLVCFGDLFGFYFLKAPKDKPALCHFFSRSTASWRVPGPGSEAKGTSWKAGEVNKLYHLVHWLMRLSYLDARSFAEDCFSYLQESQWISMDSCILLMPQ